MLNAYSQNSKTTITLGRSGTYGKLNGETLEKKIVMYGWMLSSYPGHNANILSNLKMSICVRNLTGIKLDY